MAVPYIFATATTSIPLSQLDSNFATPITLGNTSVYLGNTTTSVGNLTLTNATISTVATTFPNSFLANSSLTIGTTNVSLGGTTSSLANVTLSNVTISSGSINITNVSVSNITVTGGTIDGTAIGSTSASTGKFTTLTDSGLTSGRVNYNGTGGLLVDSANLTFDGTILSATRFAGALNGTVGATTPSTGAFTTLSGTGQLTLTNAIDYNLYASGAGANYMAGSLGIGTTSPAALLHVSSGAAKIRIGLTASSQYTDIYRDGATGFTIYNAAQPSFSSHIFQITGTEYARIGTTGTISLGAGPGAESLRVTPVASAVNYYNVTGGATGSSPYLQASGSDTNIHSQYLSKGTFGHIFNTGSAGNFQFYIAHTASAVNYLQATGGATTAGVNFSAQGSDTNIFITYDTKGTEAHSFRTNAGAQQQFRIAHTASAVNFLQVSGNVTGQGTVLSSQGSDANVNMLYLAKGTGKHGFGTGGGAYTEQFAVTHTASAVNYLQVTGNVTGFGPSITASGSDTNIPIYMIAKGASPIYFIGQSNNNQFAVNMTASAVNFASVAGGATGNSVTFAAQGSDTNVDLALVPQGTGVVKFGTYTAGVIAQAGYISIKDAGGTTRRLLVG